MKTNTATAYTVSITRSRDLHISPAVYQDGVPTNRLFRAEGGEVLPINNSADIVGVLYDTHQVANFAAGATFNRLGTEIARVEGVHVIGVNTDKVFRMDAGDKPKTAKLTPEGKVLKALEGDSLTMAEIIEETGLESGEVRSILAGLTKTEKVVATKVGKRNEYSLAEAK